VSGKLKDTDFTDLHGFVVAFDIFVGIMGLFGIVSSGGKLYFSLT